MQQKSKLDQVHSLLNERKKLMNKLSPLLEKRDLNPDEQSMIDNLTQTVADLDDRVSLLEEQVAQDPEDDKNQDSPPEGTPQPEPMPAENSHAKLKSMEARLHALEAKVKPASRRSVPMTPGYAPGYVRDLNDRQANQDRDLCLRGWTLAPTGNLQDKHLAAAERQGFNLDNRVLNFRLWDDRTVNSFKAEFRKDAKGFETRTQSEGVLLANGSAGGYLVPTGFLPELEKNLLYYANLREVARVIRTDTGNPVQIPVVDDTSNSGERVSENVAFSSQDVAFSQKTLQAFKYTSKLVNASIELMQDSAIDIPGMLGGLLGERLGRIQQTDFTLGTGSGQPEGCLTSATNSVTAASPTALAVNDIIGLTHSLDRAYRDQAVFMMHDSILQAIRQLKDSLGRPIFTESYMVGEPNRLLGYPVFINQSMPSSIASGAKSILFGDFQKGLFIRDAMDLQIVRLDERYAELGQVAFVGLMRADSRVIQPRALKYLLH